MIHRFIGPENRARLVESLGRQLIVQNDEVLAGELAEVVELIQAELNDVVITQDAVDNDMYFIFAGTVEIRMNGRQVAIRSVGQSVGEIAMMDNAAPRCAEVVAIQQTVLAKMPERSFVSIANRHPRLWRELAIDLGRQVRENGRYVKPRNPCPSIFIGSSAESRAVAWEIRDALVRENMFARAWTDDVFRVSATSIESLERELAAADFAVLVVSADDVVVSRNIEKGAPRDNVIWEHGFFSGGLGRARTYLVKPRGLDLKMPSDLLGIASLDFHPSGTIEDLPARLGPVVNGIRKAVERLGPK